MKKVFSIFVGIVISLVAVAAIFGFPKFRLKRNVGPKFQKGMCYTTWNQRAYGTAKSGVSLEKLKSMNVEWIAILATRYQDNCFSTSIFSTEKTPSDQSFKHAIEKAHSLGLKVMVKPHLDLLSTEKGGWRGEIACIRETDWEVWFESYKQFMLHYARIAEETKAEMFCMGTELTAATASHTDKWKEVIRAIRKVYSGKLTYAANWSEEYLHIRFWDDLDYAGIDAYFPLSEKDSPTYEELMESWKKWVVEIEAWQKEVNKPVIFPEIGYRSSTKAAYHPWEHVPGTKVDLELQLNCYKALVDTFINKEWFYGVYWWDWGTSIKMGGKFNRNFTPQNKPAQDYIKRLYKRRISK